MKRTVGWLAGMLVVLAVVLCVFQYRESQFQQAVETSLQKTSKTFKNRMKYFLEEEPGEEVVVIQQKIQKGAEILTLHLGYLQAQAGTSAERQAYVVPAKRYVAACQQVLVAADQMLQASRERQVAYHEYVNAAKRLNPPRHSDFAATRKKIQQLQQGLENAKHTHTQAIHNFGGALVDLGSASRAVQQIYNDESGLELGYVQRLNMMYRKISQQMPRQE